MIRVFLLSLVFASALNAQPYDFIPKEYHLMTSEEKAKLVPPYTGVSFLMDDGKYLENKDVAAMKANGGYEQLFYGDKKGNVRIIVSRKLSDAELQKRKEDYLKLKTESHEKLNALIGKPFPEMGLTNLDGTPFSVTNSGKSTVLYFWFTNCPECEKILPEFNKLYNTYKDRFNFVSPTLDNKQLVEKYVKTHITPQPKLVAGSELKKQYIDFFPTVMILDREGNILAVQDATGMIENLKVKLYEISSKNKVK
ncbi:TlpA family protein disulfide reductase [Flavobacterium silvaticum]|uniref:TlpA family protein disulfide reductase n=1 Tax=Flavobacterium silvaticum TaxID=1852020 RepID=A0A972FUI5_9FLAO|nr:TlpA disulfide reductase family protein [Flavobacterium silvaticum]NMH27830.1 TlpA family protein disulfide reductase [Flavobacterium silvaticum]